MGGRILAGMALLAPPKAHRLSPSPPQRQPALLSLRCSSSSTRGAVACQAQPSSSPPLAISIEEVEAGLANTGSQEAPAWAKNAAAPATQAEYAPPIFLEQKFERLTDLAQQAAGTKAAALSNPELCHEKLEELCVLLPDIPKSRLLYLDDAVLLELLSDTALVANRLVQLRLSAPNACWSLPAFIGRHLRLLGSARWDSLVSSCIPLACFRGHADRVSCVAITPDGRQAVSGDDRGELKVWNLHTFSSSCVATIGNWRQNPDGHFLNVSAVAITPDGRHAVSGGLDSTLKVWDLATHACVATLKGHNHKVTSVVVTPDGRRAVSGSYDKRVCVWDLQTSALLTTLTGHTRTVFSVAVTPDGLRAVSVGFDTTLGVWDLGSCTCTSTFTATRRASVRLSSVAVAPTGHFALVGCYDASIQVWDLRQQAMTARLEGHTKAVRSVAISRDGRLAVSGSGDKSVRVWDLQAQPPACIARLKGHTRAVTCVAIAPDGRSVVSGSDDMTVCVWDLQPHYVATAATSPSP